MPNTPLPPTEGVDPAFEDLDLWPVDTQLQALWQSQLAAVAAIGPALPALTRAVEAALPRLRAGGRLIYAGAGSSARISAQDGAELEPTFDWPEDKVAFLIAGGTKALTQAVENAEDDYLAGERAVADLNVGPNDILIGVAASGRTPYTIGCVEAGGKAGALTIAIAGAAESPLLKAASYPVPVLTGSEPIAGSTRMKAGTAQKIVLNLISTSLMTGLGRVWRGRMIDMRARNEKLRNRAVSMVASLAECDSESAATALKKTNYRVKSAILVAMGLSPDAVQSVLDEVNGNIRAAIVKTGLDRSSSRT
ncbi:MAG: N-acetylmuramic acid 6-phosphate etherase [Acetobacter sp.]|nr:N-acetylmuramic acid 6-phosphate etherase [Acetobacter sp.]